MQGIAIRTHQEEQFYANQNEEIPPIPQGPYNDADYEMSVDEGLGYVPEIDELPQAENIIFGKASKEKEKESYLS